MSAPGSGAGSVSLWIIDATIADLMDMREAATDPTDIAVIDGQLIEWAQQEVRKVDSIAGYLKHCAMMEAAAKAEAAAQADRAHRWQERGARLKRACQRVMETFTGGDRKKIEGRTAALLLKANGGRQAVTIADESLVPNEYFEYVGAIPAVLWDAARAHVAALGSLPMVARPRLSLIYDALQAQCPACAGGGKVFFTPDVCPSCGGTGKAGVPGAQLEPRGSHIEIK